MRKIILALSLSLFCFAGAKAQPSVLEVINNLDCNVYLSFSYADLSGCEFISDTPYILILAGTTTPIHYNTPYPAYGPWLPPGCGVGNIINDGGYFYSATVYDADPANTGCQPYSTTVGIPYFYAGPLSNTFSTSSCMKCRGVTSITCTISNIYPPTAPTTTLTIN